MVVYLDYNATTPLSDAVMQCITENLTVWGNPSSANENGKAAKRVIELARNKVAQLINAASSQDIIFESGGTEVNNHVIHSAIREYHIDHGRIGHVITTNIEHDAICLPLLELQAQAKCEVTMVEVDKVTGSVDADKILAAIKPNTCLVTVIMANNETGVIQPIAEIGERLQALNCARIAFRVYFHSDAAQAVGKIAVDVQALNVDFLTIVGHKFYGPRIGALYVRGLQSNAIRLHPLLFGGGQEGSYRPGTENTPVIAGLGCAADESRHFLQSTCCTSQILNLKHKMKRLLEEKIDPVEFHFENSLCLPNTLSVCMPNSQIPVSQFVSKCCDAGLIISAGAACHSNSQRPSRVLLASGIPEEKAVRTLRISLGRETNENDVETAVHILHAVFSSL